MNYIFCWQVVSVAPAKGNPTSVTCWSSSRVTVNTWIKGKRDSREEAFHEKSQ